MALTPYATGTVSVSANGTVVTGVGTIWSGTNAFEGDRIVIDDEQDVLITGVTDTTHLTIPKWQYGDKSGVSYAIYKTSALRFDDVQIAQDLEKQVAALNTTGFVVFVGLGQTEPDPSIGDNDQYAHQPSTGLWWLKAAGEWDETTPPANGGAVVYSIAQSLTGPQQAQAIQNIGLGKNAPTLQMFGGNPASSDSMAVVRLAAAYCNTNGITSIRVDDAFTCTTYADADQALLADITFVGNGSLAGVYRKHVIPMHAPSDALEVMDLIPEIHLTAMNRAGASPKIVITGDSTATYLANSVGRQALIVEAVKRKITEEFATPTFVNMSIGGRTYAGLHAATGVTNEWSTDPTKTWLPFYIKNAAPDVIVLDFGMNDSAGVSYTQINMIFAEVNTWTKIPDVVFCTNSMPSLAWPGSATKTEQEGRDMAAGMTRTFAQFNRKGLIDFHRKFCMARDGFDPLSSALRTGNSVTVSGGACTGTTECWDFKANIHFNGASWTAGSTTDFLLVKTGTGSADFLQITKSAGGFYVFTLFGGDIGDSVSIGNATTTVSIPGSATSIVVEKFGNRLTIYSEAVAFGTNTEPLFSSRVIAKGGRYLPRVDNNGNAGLSSVDFSYGEPRANKPSVTNTALLGNVDGLGVPYGGFGGNHPTSIAFTNVYWPIIGQSRWAGAPPLAWASYTPTFSTQGGSGTTFTVNKARYLVDGKLVTLHFDISVSAVGTGTGYIFMTTPVNTNGDRYSVAGVETDATGKPLQGVCTSAGQLGVKLYDGNTAIVASARLIGGMVYETP